MRQSSSCKFMAWWHEHIPKPKHHQPSSRCHQSNSAWKKHGKTMKNALSFTRLLASQMNIVRDIRSIWDTGKSWIRILQILMNAPFPGTWSKKPMTAAVVAAFWLARHVTFRSRVTMSTEVSCYAVMSSDSPLLSTALTWKQSLGPPGTTPNYLSEHVMLFHVFAWMQ